MSDHPLGPLPDVDSQPNPRLISSAWVDEDTTARLYDHGTPGGVTVGWGDFTLNGSLDDVEAALASASVLVADLRRQREGGQ